MASLSILRQGKMLSKWGMAMQFLLPLPGFTQARPLLRLLGALLTWTGSTGGWRTDTFSMRRSTLLTEAGARACGERASSGPLCFPPLLLSPPPPQGTCKAWGGPQVGAWVACLEGASSLKRKQTPNCSARFPQFPQL